MENLAEQQGDLEQRLRLITNLARRRPESRLNNGPASHAAINSGRRGTSRRIQQALSAEEMDQAIKAPTRMFRLVIQPTCEVVDDFETLDSALQYARTIKLSIRGMLCVYNYKGDVLGAIGRTLGWRYQGNAKLPLRTRS